MYKECSTERESQITAEDCTKKATHIRENRSSGKIDIPVCADCAKVWARRGVKVMRR